MPSLCLFRRQPGSLSCRYFNSKATTTQDFYSTFAAIIAFGVVMLVAILWLAVYKRVLSAPQLLHKLLMAPFSL